MVRIFCKQKVQNKQKKKKEKRATTYKVDTDRADVALGVGVIRETQKQAGLADTRVTDQQELEEEVAAPKEKHGENARQFGKINILFRVHGAG